MIKIVSEDLYNKKNNEPQRGLLLDSKPKIKKPSWYLNKNAIPSKKPTKKYFLVSKDSLWKYNA